MKKKQAESGEIEAVAQLRQLLSDVGLRTTAARTAVLRWLQRSKAPATHAEIALDLVPLGFDKATVFRNLNDLSDVGLVTRSELGDRVWRFELRNPAHTDVPHPHFVCIDCGRIICLHDLDLPHSAKKELAPVGKVTEIMMRGRCVACG
ncbi:Fur family transcriptional regulator [Schlesneria paludicola]|uniref:Fur family transcriptional regulator n=1 Tax=Schlesneria paludicola TaxID=360056 RepID=UPI000492C512|nr:transcriptional repressor [Schlesneria paludicola]